MALCRPKENDIMKISEGVDFGAVEDLGQQVYQVSVQWRVGVVNN